MCRASPGGSSSSPCSSPGTRPMCPWICTLFEHDPSERCKACNAPREQVLLLCTSSMELPAWTTPLLGGGRGKAAAGKTTAGRSLRAGASGEGKCCNAQGASGRATSRQYTSCETNVRRKHNNNVYIFLYIYIYMHAHIHIHVYICIYIYMCIYI